MHEEQGQIDCSGWEAALRSATFSLFAPMSREYASLGLRSSYGKGRQCTYIKKPDALSVCKVRLSTIHLSIRSMSINKYDLEQDRRPQNIQQPFSRGIGFGSLKDAEILQESPK